MKQYLTEKNLLFLLIGLLLITTFLDVYTAFTSPIFEAAELNPIYLLTGSKAPPLILTVIITFWIIKTLNKSLSIFRIFTFTLFTIYLIAGHLVGVYSNISATERYNEAPEETIEALKQSTSSEKFVSYSILMGIIMILPIFFSVTAFIIALFFYNKRKPERDKITDEIYRLVYKLRK